MIYIAIIKRLGVPRGLKKTYVDGGTLNLLETINIFNKPEYSVTIFTTNEDNGISIETVNNIKIVRLSILKVSGKPDMSHDFNEGILFSQAILKNNIYNSIRYDYIYTHHWSSILPPLIGKINPIKAHIHIPHLLAFEKQRLLNIDIPSEILASERIILSSANTIIALSASEKNSIINAYNTDPDKIVIIPNGVDICFVKGNKIKNNLESKTMILSIGRISRQKGYHVLIEAINKLTKAGYNLYCNIAGEIYRGEYEYINHLKDKINSYDLNHRVIFLGEIDHKNLLDIMSTSDIYVQSSLYESQGIALLEAMCCMLPVVASNLPAISEYITNNINGMLFDPGNSDELAQKIETYLLNNDIAKIYSQNAYNVKSIYNWEITRDKMSKIFT